MTGDEWMLQQFDVHNKFTQFNTFEYDSTSEDDESPVDLVVDISVSPYDVLPNIFDHYLDQDRDDFVIVDDDEAVSVASSAEPDRSFDWLFVNNKFMYT